MWLKFKKQGIQHRLYLSIDVEFFLFANTLKQERAESIGSFLFFIYLEFYKENQN